MKALYSLLLLVGSNIFMTFAWYGHLRFTQNKTEKATPLILIILISWAIAFFEYCMQIPANRIGFKGTGGPFSLIELKVLQEVITLAVFVCFSIAFFKEESFKWNHYAGFACLILAVVFIFKKW